MTKSFPKSLFEKIWEQHIVRQAKNEPALLYIDLHLVHEVTSPQAFEGLRLAGRRVRRPECTLATVDHNIPTESGRTQIQDPIAARQVDVLRQNCAEYGIRYFDMHSPDQGIVHVIGPDLGLTQPGMTIVCGDSHTSTHGAFGAMAFGIGTSEVEHVLATQCLPQDRPQTMELRVNGALSPGVTAKDLVLGMIGQIGTDGASGHIVEYTGKAIRELSMEARMTVCNMSIEAGARAGMVSPDSKTFSYLKGRRYAPQGALWNHAVEKWTTLATDAGARFDRTVEIDASQIAPNVTWGTNPGMVIPIHGHIPDPAAARNEPERVASQRALEYMGLLPGTPIQDVSIDRVFIGSCTNSRLEDLRAAAKVAKGYSVHPRVRAMVVPGSHLIKALAEKEGLDQIFRTAGFDWREAGCSMCLGMNPDVLQSGERCASTSNRNFEGRQGKGGRTHLVSPSMAAAAAIAGQFVDVRSWKYKD